MQNGASNIKDSNYFKSKIININIPNDALLVTADVVGLCPGISHKAGLSALREALDKITHQEIPTENLIKMAEFVLKNNFFKFETNVISTDFGYCYWDKICTTLCVHFYGPT